MRRTTAENAGIWIYGIGFWLTLAVTCYIAYGAPTREDAVNAIMYGVLSAFVWPLIALFLLFAKIF